MLALVINERRVECVGGSERKKKEIISNRNNNKYINK